MNVGSCDILGVVARRSYGSGSLQIRADRNGRETWYALWRVGERRVKRRVGLKRSPSCADGLTRVMAEKEMRRLIAETAVPLGTRMTVAEAGTIYIEHLEVAMERKRTTVADYRGYLNRHLGPFFGGRPLDKIDRARVEAYLLAKKHEGLSSKTAGNHLMVVEIKMVRERLTARRLGEELAIDAVRYRAHPGAHVLVCFVHDPQNRIANPRGIESDLEALSDGDLQIVAVIG